MPALSYDLLLDLYRGKASVVEQLTAEQRDALSVATPLAHYLEEVGRQGAPRHIFLTGNAGDGKTFAAYGAERHGFHVVRDASAGESGGEVAPIHQLAERLTKALAAGHRMLVAINRGQLERLAEFTRRKGQQETPLTALVAEAYEQSRLREAWPADASTLVALIDLGLLDTVSRPVVDPMLAKVCSVEASGLSLESQTALTASQAALRSDEVRGWIYRSLEAARASGHHATMRQLWSFLAFLLTGRRASDSRESVSLEDAVGARLFSDDAEGPLFERAREAVDPLTTPFPRLAREVLLGRAHAALKENKESAHLEPLLGAGPDLQVSGATLVRVAAVHGSPLARTRPAEADTFEDLLQALQKKLPGWYPFNTVTRRLLRGIYRALRLWNKGASFPAWQTLCYDSSRLSDAASVAVEDVDLSTLRLALPRPPRECERALAGAWRPPYLWLAAETPGLRPADGALRLTPTLFRSLFALDGDSGYELTTSEALTIQRWLSRLRGGRRADGVRVGKHEIASPLLLIEAPFSPEKTVVTWESSDGAN